MTEASFDPLALLTPAEVCRLLGGEFTEPNLAQLRYLGSGPPYVKITGRQVRYRRSDVAEWIEQQTRVQTPGGRTGAPGRRRRKPVATSA
jgi:predicted DNA-binding transcriptional regulator AlpA